MISVPLRTARGLNDREHYRARAKRVKAERTAVAWTLVAHARPPLPCTVLLTRCAPSSGLDDDGLCGALKGVRDEIADWLGVNDRDSTRVRYLYAQVRAAWGVRIEFGPPASGQQLELLGVPQLPSEATA